METATHRRISRLHIPIVARRESRPSREPGGEGRESRLTITGAFDATTVTEVILAIESVVAERSPRITIDMEQVTLMDSAGASALRELWMRMRAEQREVVVVGARDQPLLVLRVLHLDAPLCR